MKADLTEVVFILDRSGSMAGLVDDTIGGFNSFIRDQRNADGECFLTTVLFDDQYEILHDHIDLKEVKDITAKEYFPRGMTALLDALGKTINAVGERLAKTDEGDRPERVIFVVTTDGQENSSREFAITKIKEMVKHQEDKYKWEFLFLGANIDAFGAGGSMGMSMKGVTNYAANAVGTAALYSSVSNFVADSRSFNSMRKAKAMNTSMQDYYSEAEDEAEKGATNLSEAKEA